jgi:hypothetical protein
MKPKIECVKEEHNYRLSVTLGDNVYSSKYVDTAMIAANLLMETVVDRELGFSLNDLIRAIDDCYRNEGK